MFYILERININTMASLLDTFINSRIRVNILMRLFLNTDQEAYLRELAREFDVSSSQISYELKKLQQAGLLTTRTEGRLRKYGANKQHPLFPELQSMVKKSLGMDRIMESIVSRLGNLKLALVTGNYAVGKDTDLIDLILVGKINRPKLDDLVKKTEKYIKRRIRYLILSEEEYEKMKKSLAEQPLLVLWQKSAEGANE